MGRLALPTPLAAPRRLPLWAAGALVAVLTWLQMVRRPGDPPLWDSLFTEDGKVFLSQALTQSFLDSLATSYLGYLHTAPRGVALVATWVPLEDAPLVISLLTTLVVALVCVYVFEASAAWIASPLLRGVLALAVAFAPVTAREIAGSLSNLHYFLIYGAFWAVICPWQSVPWLAGSTLLVAAAVLSNPLTGVLLPIALVFALRAGTRRAWVLPGTIVAGVALQLLLRDESASSFGGSDYAAIPRIFAERVTSSLLVGDRYLEDVFGGSTGSPFAWGSLALIAVIVAAALWRLRERRRWLVAAAALLSIAYFLISVLGRGTLVLYPSKPWLLASTRYVYLPVLFLLTAVVAAADRREPGGRRIPLREAAVAVLVLGTIVAGYRAPHRSEGSPRWKPALREARLACAARRPRGTIDLYGSGADLTAVVPIATPEDWAVPVNCSKLH
ncbi:MAG TPA: glycosyltransferase 87 family protein [Thermoleophilaceae bacterium]|nr:glycosyltransferase 87 family protein [Thermoleophilaceae bacterium]